MRTIFSALLLCICSCLLAGFVAAQDVDAMAAGSNGVTVFFKTRSSGLNSALQPSGAVFFTDQKGSEMRVHRIISDRVNKMFFGYDVVVERSGSGRASVSIKPLSVAPPEQLGLKDLAVTALSKYPAQLSLEEGDTIALDVLANPKTGEKITDHISIRLQKTIEMPDTSFPVNSRSTNVAASEIEAPGSFTTDAIRLRLTSPQLVLNGTRSDLRGADWSGIIEGSILSVYVPGKGRFVFSLFPRSDSEFKETAVLERNKIGFRHGGDHIEVLSAEPIVETAGSWKLWMLIDANYKPSSTTFLSNSNPVEYVEYGAANVHAVAPTRRPRARSGPQKDFYLRWLEDDVRYIITEQEKSSFLGLATDAEREAFIDSFWRRRDSDTTTPENEFRRDHYSRLAFANAKFTFAGNKGSASDRGRIYIQKGVPDNVVRQPGREIWIYENGERFEFVDTQGIGDFRLVGRY